MPSPYAAASCAAVLLVAAACSPSPSRLPPSNALRPPLPGPLEPAPVPSEAALEFDAQRRASRAAAPSGPDAMPGFDQRQRVGTDMTTAPIPADRIQRPQ